MKKKTVVVLGLVTVLAVLVGLVVRHATQPIGGFGRAHFNPPKMLDYSDPPPWWLFKVVLAVDRLLVELRRALLPPMISTFQLMGSHVQVQAINAVTKLGIPDLIGDGLRTSEELAAATEVDPTNLYRVLRALSAIGYFVEVEEGLFGNTELSAVLRKDHPNTLRSNFLMHHSHIQWMASEGLIHSVTTPGPGFQHVYPDQDFWSLHEDNKEMQDLFDQAMTETGSLGNPALIQDYDFSKCNRVIDVGGGKGDFVRQLMTVHPNMTAIVFDQPWVIEVAEAEWKQRNILLDRIEFASGDFFESIPTSNADCYIMRGVIHDWNDTKAIQILKNIHKTMVDSKNKISTKQKLILVEVDFIRPFESDVGRLTLDLVMMIAVDGRARGTAEFENLFKESGFALQGVYETRSQFTVLDAVIV